MLIGAGRRRIRVEVGHLLFVLAVAGYCIWRLIDARAASATLQNLLLIEPLVVVAVVLCAIIAAGTIARAADEAGERHASRRSALSPARDENGGGRLRGAWRSGTAQILAFMLLLAAYVVGIPTIGFDAASFAFIALSLLLQGERRLWLVLIMPLLFTALTTYVFKTLLLVNVPTLIG